MNKTDEPCHC